MLKEINNNMFKENNNRINHYINNTSIKSLKDSLFNRRLVINSFLGLFLALLFTDIKNNIFDDFLLKIITKKTQTTFVLNGITFETIRLVETAFHIFFALLFFFIIYYFY
mgnify:FL=1|jgi:hypothetical protein